MTIDKGRALNGQATDTHDMVVVHRAFRRESRLLSELIASAPCGDRKRSRILANHLRWYQAGLSNHHHGEDELVWPLLHARVDVDFEVVSRMERQHEQITGTLDQVMSALSRWEESIADESGQQLLTALVEHRVTLIEHLDDEEAHLLPLASRYLSQAEWDALGEHFVQTTPKSQLVIFLGAVLEEASPDERSALLGSMPAIARIVWASAGRFVYARHIRRVRGDIRSNQSGSGRLHSG